MAIANYQLQPDSGRVVLFCADASEDDRGWSSMPRGQFETDTIDGDRYTMMRSPRVKTLAQKLKDCLNSLK